MSRSRGRPTLLTPERRDKIVQLIEAGNYIHVAAIASGVARSTVFGWLTAAEDARAAVERGEEISERERELLDFADAMNLARARAEAAAVLHIQRQIRGGVTVRETTRQLPGGGIETDKTVTPPDGRLALEYLARTAPDRWGRRAIVEHSDTDAGGPAPTTSAGVLAQRVHRALQQQQRELEQSAIVEAEVVDDDRE